MGLRIIDRHGRRVGTGRRANLPRGTPAAPEPETDGRDIQEREAARSYAAIEGGELAEDHFLAKLRAAHARHLQPEVMLARAEEVRAALRLRQTSPTPVHAKIDIATLMELL